MNAWSIAQHKAIKRLAIGGNQELKAMVGQVY